MKLEVNSLCGGYGGKLVLDGVEFTVRSGSIVTLLGANGCGKSTLLKIIGRILKPKSGSVLLDGKAISRIKTGDLARELAILPQLHHASGELSVEELVAFGRFPHRGLMPGATVRDREIIDRSIRMTRLESLRKRPLYTLSGGERQRAWVAMTLAQEPGVLLLDEPTTFLDVCCQFEIIDVVRRLNRQYGVTVVMVLHDMNLAASCSDELILMKNHKIHCAGTPASVITRENLRAVFEIESKITVSEEGIPYCIATGSARGEAL